MFNAKVAKEEKPFDKAQGRKERKEINLPNDLYFFWRQGLA